MQSGRWLVRVAIPALVALVLAACAGRSSPPPPPTPHPLAAPRMLNLSHIITADMPHRPDQQGTTFTRAPHGGKLHSVTLDPRSGTSLTITATATLTNMTTAPRTVDQLAPHDTIAPVVVLDRRDAAQDTPTYRLSVAEIHAWEAQHGRIPPDCFVLLATGWDIRWSTPGDYMNLDGTGSAQVPGFGAAALRLLLVDRGVRGVGTDTPIYGGPPADGEHIVRSWLVLENLINLEQVPPVGATLVVGVLRLQHSAASPAAVTALLP